MPPSWPSRSAWLLLWLALVLVGWLLAVRADIAQRREAFQADARIAHRLLSQRTAQHEAVLATLALLAPPADDASRPAQRLAALYPQLLGVQRRDGEATWPDPALQQAEARSRSSRRAEVAGFDAVAGRYALVLAGSPSSYALHVDLQRSVPWEEWPLRRDGPVRVALRHRQQALLLQPGLAPAAQPAGLTTGFTFAKPLSTPSQPFELQLHRATGPAQWPWAWLAGWALLCGVVLAALAARLASRREQHRTQALLRVGQAARLGALGELAGGIAHELNQPLAALLANTQAARRLLDDDPPELSLAREAMALAAGQARRAADVVARLRRQVESPGARSERQPVLLQHVLRDAAALLQPEAQRRSVHLSIEGDAPAVLADPVALEQIVHNLVDNALQALKDVPAHERRLVLAVRHEGGQGLLTVRDSGPGISPAAMPHVFEPFYSTKSGGLGLGLSLCESLARGMEGTLAVRPAVPRGAEFTLTLPLAKRQELRQELRQEHGQEQQQEQQRS